MNSSAFFGRQVRVRNPSTPYRSGRMVDSSGNYSNRIERRVQRTPTTKSLLSIRRKVFDVENTLNSLFNLNKKSSTMKKRVKLVQSEEEKNGKKKSVSGSNLGGLIQRPKTGAMDFISNFLTFTFLGWLFTVFQPLIGKLEGLLPLLSGALSFFSGVLTSLLSGFASFVEFGYGTHDKIKGAADQIKNQSSNIKKAFDDTTDALAGVLNSTVQVATSFLDIFNETYDKQSLSSTNTTQENIVDFSSLANSVAPRVTTYASGGAVDTGRIDPRTPIKRGIDQKRKPEQKQKPIPQQLTTQPGKDVGGIDKIQELYDQKSDTTGFNIFSTFNKTDKSGYAALTKTSEEFKRTNSSDFLGIGNLTSASVDAALGQKPEKRAYTQFAEGISYLVNFGLTQPEEFRKLNIEQMIENIVQSKVDSAINKVREEINKKSRVEEGGPGGGPGDPGGGDGEGPIYKFKKGAPGSKELQEEVEKTAIELGIPAPDLLGVILAESGGDPSKTNQFGCTGLIQFCPGPSSGQAVVGKTGDQLRRMSIKEQMKYVIKYLKAVGVKPGMSGYDIYSAIHAGRPGGNIVDANNVSTRSFYESNVKPLIEQAKKYSEQEERRITGPGAITADKIFPLEKGQGKDASNEPGIDFTYKGGQTLALYPGKVVDISTQFDSKTGRGYGNYVLVESVDPNNGRKFTTLYAHFGNGKIKVRKGDVIEAGAVIGPQPNKGKPGYFTGSGSGEHTSADFYELDGRTRYANADKLISQILGSFTSKTKGYPTHRSDKEDSPSPGQSPQPKPGTKPTPKPTVNNPVRQKLLQVLGALNLLPGKKYTIKGKTYYVDKRGGGIIRDESGVDYDLSNGANQWLLKEINRIDDKENNKSIPKKKYGGLVYSRGSDPQLPPDKYASYNDPSMTSTILIQPIIKSKIVPIETGSNSPIMFAAPNVNSSSSNFELMRS